MSTWKKSKIAKDEFDKALKEMIVRLKAERTGK